MTPLRFTILQCSHSFFTDALTFILKSFCFNQNPPHGQIVGRQLQFHSVAGFQPGKILLRLARPRTPSAGGRLPVPRARCRSAAPSITRPSTWKASSGHVKISGSPSVTRTVCSKWADSEPSCVTTVQPSFKIFTSGRTRVDHRLNRHRHARLAASGPSSGPQNSVSAALRASSARRHARQIPAPR